MQWKVEHLIAASRAEVERALLDPSTTEVLPQYMPGIGKATVLSLEKHGAITVLRKKFEPSMQLPSFARGIDPEMTHWVESVRWDHAKHEATFEIDANVPAEWKRYFSASGVYRLELRGAQTLRVIEGTLSVKVPLVGSIAERYIVGVLRDWFDGEARGLTVCATSRAAVAA
jgi:hypothetical protein